MLSTDRFTLDGVALGQAREEVDRLLGCPLTNANPCWARYCFADRLLLVRYKATKPDDPTERWVAESLCGSELRWKGRTFLKVGSQIPDQSHVLGQPQEFYESEPGVGCLDFTGCQVSFDIHSGRILEVSLHRCEESTAQLPVFAHLSAAC